MLPVFEQSPSVSAGEGRQDGAMQFRIGMFPTAAPFLLKFHDVSLRNAADEAVLESEVR